LISDKEIKIITIEKVYNDMEGFVDKTIEKLCLIFSRHEDTGVNILFNVFPYFANF